MKTKELKIKMVVGFRKDQEYTIGMDEAHKAYHLFLNPEERGVFSNGLAICGKEIQRIEPDYNATMGWNPGYVMNGYDWEEVRAAKVDCQLRNTMSKANEIARTNPELLSKPLSEILTLKAPAHLLDDPQLIKF